MSNGILAEGKSATKWRVLLVEDNQVFAMVYKGLLGKEGYEVTHVAEGDAALSALQYGHYDVVLLDLMLPEMDGIEILRRTRSRDQSFSTPVIVLTESDLEEVRRDADRLGVRRCFTKTGTHAREILGSIRSLMPAEAEVARPRTDVPAGALEPIPVLKMSETPPIQVRKISQVGPDPLESVPNLYARKHRNAAARDLAGFFQRLLSS